MALLEISWDLPPSDRLPLYHERIRTEWVPTLLHQPGVREFRGYRNPHQTSPQVRVHVEYSELGLLYGWLESRGFATMLNEMREVGCSGFRSEVWEASPVMPEPLRPVAEFLAL